MSRANSNYQAMWKKKREEIFEQGAIDFIASLPESKCSLPQAIILSMAQQLEPYYDRPLHTLSAEITSMAQAKCPRMTPKLIKRALQNTPYIDRTKQTSGRMGAAKTNAMRAAKKAASIISGQVTNSAVKLSAKTSIAYSCEVVSGNIYNGVGGYCPTSADHIIRITEEHSPVIRSDQFAIVQSLMSMSGATMVNFTMDEECNAVTFYNDFGPYDPSCSGQTFGSGIIS